MAALLTEVVLTFMFLFIIFRATDRRAPQGFAPIAIGLGLTLIHLIGIPINQSLRQSSPQHRSRPLRGRLGARATLALLDRPNHRCRIGKSRLSSRRGQPEAIRLEFSRYRTRRGRKQATAVSGRPGHSEIRRSDHARWDRLSSEKMTGADRDC